MRQRLDALGPAPRAELLHVLMLPDLERAERIGEFWSYPQSRTFAELLIDCEEDRTLRPCWLACSSKTERGVCSSPSVFRLVRSVPERIKHQVAVPGKWRRQDQEIRGPVGPRRARLEHVPDAVPSPSFRRTCEPERSSEYLEIALGPIAQEGRRDRVGAARSPHEVEPELAVIVGEHAVESKITAIKARHRADREVVVRSKDDQSVLDHPASVGWPELDTAKRGLDRGPVFAGRIRPEPSGDVVGVTISEEDSVEWARFGLPT